MQKPSLLLASALLMCGAVQLHADEVKLTTALPAGENLLLALNSDLTVELSWGNGDKQTVVSHGTLQEIPVKDAELTITSTTGAITSLYVQGNKLSALNLTGAVNLKHLYAADNELTALSLGRCKMLESIDVQNNQLSSLSISSQSELKDLNASFNQIGGTGVRVSSSSRLASYIVADNELTGLPSSSVLRDVETVWAQNNNISTLNLGMSSNLRSVCVSNNEVKTANLAEAPLLHDVWVDHNNLTELDLSKGSPKLFTLSADHNKMSIVKWDFDCKKVCKNVYLHNNALFINSMPSATIAGKDVNVVYEPQADYAVEPYYPIDEKVDFYDLVIKNGWGLSTRAKYDFITAEGDTLVKNEDYQEFNKRFAFTKPVKGVVFVVYTDDYKFQTTPFNVGTLEAIDDVTANEALQILTAHGTLTVKAGANTPVSIYNAAGVCVAREMVSGARTWNVAAGIYVVNGEKVLVP